MGNCCNIFASSCYLFLWFFQPLTEGELGEQLPILVWSRLVKRRTHIWQMLMPHNQEMSRVNEHVAACRLVFVYLYKSRGFCCRLAYYLQTKFSRRNRRSGLYAEIFGKHSWLISPLPIWTNSPICEKVTTFLKKFPNFWKFPNILRKNPNILKKKSQFYFE